MSDKKINIWPIIALIISGLISGGSIVYGATRYAGDVQFNTMLKEITDLKIDAKEKEELDEKQNEKINQNETNYAVILNKLENIDDKIVDIKELVRNKK